MPELPRPLPPPTWRDRLAALQQWRDAVPIPALAGLLVALVVATLALTGFAGGGAQPDVAVSLPRAAATGPVDPGGAHASTTTAGQLRVHAAGAVLHPGVVEVPAGARVVDVVAAAGGPSPDADLHQVNLAELVADGQRVYIPRAGETAIPSGLGGSGPAALSGTNRLVNLNDADQALLETLPGVGPATAKAIVDYRNQHGRFRSVDDLLNVRGIGPAKLEQIKPHARV